MINSLKKLLDYIYKKKCYFCSSSKDNSIFCSTCYDAIDFLPFKPVETLSNADIYSCFLYKENIQKMIRAVKYHNKKELAIFQAALMFKYWQKINNKKDYYTVIPVPLHKERLKQRKFNHMELVAKEFCKLANYDYEENLILRVKNTVPQYKLSKKEREKNLSGAFKINTNIKLPDSILLIDDITTTGTTISEIIKELNKINLNDVTALTTAIPENNSFYIY